MARSTDRISDGKPIDGAGGGDYVLEFVTSSPSHVAGSKVTLRDPYVTLGRDQGCNVVFDDSEKLVSRAHAAIEKKSDKFVLIQLSQTNQTLLNGRPVIKEWPLQSGDEIQLSPSGPKIRFAVGVSKPTSLGFTKRIQLFSQQALKPYKRAIVVLLVMVLVTTVTVFFVVREMRQKDTQLVGAYAEINKQTDEQRRALLRGDSLFVANQKATTEKLAADNREREKIALELKDLKLYVKTLQQKAAPASVIPAISITRDARPLLKMIDDVKDNIYFLKIYLSVKGQLNREDIGSGTGVMLKDGRFVTTRQCIQPWIYADVNANDKVKEQWLLINWLYNNSPKGDVRVDVELLGTDGKRTYLSGDKFIVNESRDLIYNLDVGYGQGKVQLISDLTTDWAFLKISDTSDTGLNSASKEAGEFATGAPIHFITYSKEVSDGREQILPSHVELIPPASESHDGLIDVPKFHFREGNSGSPAFLEKDGRLTLIGLLTTLNKRIVVVPIDALNKQ